MRLLARLWFDGFLMQLASLAAMSKLLSLGMAVTACAQMLEQDRVFNSLFSRSSRELVTLFERQHH